MAQEVNIKTLDLIESQDQMIQIRDTAINNLELQKEDFMKQILILSNQLSTFQSENSVIDPSLLTITPNTTSTVTENPNIRITRSRTRRITKNDGNQTTEPEMAYTPYLIMSPLPIVYSFPTPGEWLEEQIKINKWITYNRQTKRACRKSRNSISDTNSVLKCLWGCSTTWPDSKAGEWKAHHKPYEPEKVWCCFDCEYFTIRSFRMADHFYLFHNPQQLEKKLFLNDTDRYMVTCQTDRTCGFCTETQSFRLFTKFFAHVRKHFLEGRTFDEWNDRDGRQGDL